MESSKRMPVLFAAHGSPMNALEDGPFPRALNALRNRLPRPQAILCVSAHWYTHPLSCKPQAEPAQRYECNPFNIVPGAGAPGSETVNGYGKGTYVQASKKPKTIHDFGGFPQALFDVQYPAPGHPALAKRTAQLLGVPTTEDWGLDHGTWSVLVHLFPEADVPVFQVSLDASLTPREHLELGRKLAPLRDEGVLILGSGNLVHNLGRIDWNKSAPAEPWAVAFDEAAAKNITDRDDAALVDYRSLPGACESVPTPDHYLPLLYCLGASDQRDERSFPIVGFEHASISQRCVEFQPG